jgi:argininosuccinate lyase
MGKPLNQVSDQAAHAADPAFKGDWRKVFDLKRAMLAREKTGMPGPRTVAGAIARWERELR